MAKSSQRRTRSRGSGAGRGGAQGVGRANGVGVGSLTNTTLTPHLQRSQSRENEPAQYPKDESDSNGADISQGSTDSDSSDIPHGRNKGKVTAEMTPEEWNARKLLSRWGRRQEEGRARVIRQQEIELRERIEKKKMAANGGKLRNTEEEMRREFYQDHRERLSVEEYSGQMAQRNSAPTENCASTSGKVQEKKVIVEESGEEVMEEARRRAPLKRANRRGSAHSAGSPAAKRKSCYLPEDMDVKPEDEMEEKEEDEIVSIISPSELDPERQAKLIRQHKNLRTTLVNCQVGSLTGNDRPSRNVSSRDYRDETPAFLKPLAKEKKEKKFKAPQARERIRKSNGGQQKNSDRKKRRSAETFEDPAPTSNVLAAEEMFDPRFAARFSASLPNSNLIPPQMPTPLSPNGSTARQNLLLPRGEQNSTPHSQRPISQTIQNQFNFPLPNNGFDSHENLPSANGSASRQSPLVIPKEEPTEIINLEGNLGVRVVRQSFLGLPKDVVIPNRGIRLTKWTDNDVIEWLHKILGDVEEFGELSALIRNQRFDGLLVQSIATKDEDVMDLLKKILTVGDLTKLRWNATHINNMYVKLYESKN